MDTAQPMAAETDPNAQIADAANAFLAFDNPSASQPRDEQGKFASAQPDEEEEAEPEAEAPQGEDEELEDEQEAAEEAQPLPPSWGAEDAEMWATLPPEAQAKIIAREGERDRGLNLKLQESANARKEAQLAASEAQNKRNEYLKALETVEALYQVQRPDPRAFGYGTQQYNGAAYQAALAEYEQTSQVLAQLNEQREAIQKEAADEEAQQFSAWKQQHEAEYAPKLLADLPELTDPAKGEPILRELIDYAVKAGIPEENFAPDVQDQITSAQLHILWKAHQFDKARQAKAPAKPKPASPGIKPGVSSPRSTQKQVRHRNAVERLNREGSLEAAAAVFKNLM